MQASERELSDAKAIVLMELLVDKLKLLKYEQMFCQTRNPPWPRLHRFYFAMPAPNRSEQFQYFSSLVAWLYSLIGVPFPAAEEFEDPNAVSSNITFQLREVGFAPPPWPPITLKQGYGDAVCSVLDSLVDLVLELQDFQFSLPTYTDVGEPVIVDEVCKQATDELFVHDVDKTMEIPKDSTTSASTKVERTIDPAAWKVELERLAPQLSVTLLADGKDWRTHVEHSQTLHMDLLKNVSTNETQLQQVEWEISSTLEKLESREKFINSQIEPLTTEYAAVKKRLSEIQQKYGNSLDNVTEFTNEIAHITEQIEQVKQITVEKGNMISDVSPLVQMKSSIQKLKVELREMEVRIGVLRHTLLQVGLKRARKGHGIAVL